MTPTLVTTIEGALDALRPRIEAVDMETASPDDAIGRVLAEDITLDRSSPPCNVSAMDGYAVRAPIVGGAVLRVVAAAIPGRPALSMSGQSGIAIRIFTGAPVPQGATAVAQRELFVEAADTATLHRDAVVREGMNIRRAGENGGRGDIVCAAGRVLGPAQAAALASCGITQVRVYRRLRIGVLVTGDEVLAADSAPAAWQLRDSNGPSLHGMLARFPWVERVERQRVTDDRPAMFDAVRALLERTDALLVTGGVSAGDHDYVPGILRDAGAQTLFHKLAIRPGKPVLGATDAQGRPILGLPGNPVSVLVTARLLALPALRFRAGIGGSPLVSFVNVQDDACAPASLHWFPLVRTHQNGEASLVPSRGSGDWISAARSDGFVEVPPGQPARGIRRFYGWDM